MRTLKWFGMLLAVLVVCLVAEAVPATENVLTMSTTTSTQASGLLDILLPEFKKDTGIGVKVIAKGTGAALRDGMDGNVDIIFVHAKEREERFVSDGFGTRRYAVMHNDFVIVGPADDPAGIRGLNDSAAAFKKIADKGARFVSRGDDSGTHTKEQAIWKATGLALEDQKTEVVKKGKPVSVGFVAPKGGVAWYVSIGRGMGPTLTYAEEKRVYTLTDRGTYIKYKFGRKEGLDLEVLCEGDQMLSNSYGVIPISAAKHPHVKADLAKTFAGWLVSARGQRLIADYRLHGHQLFYPDAIKLTGN